MIQTRILAFAQFGVRVATFTLAVCAVMACSRYEFKFNERTVYTPPPLFTAYSVADGALKACLQQTIEDQRIIKAKALTVLACTSGGIVSLEGLETFQQLKQVNLARNTIRDVQPLTSLPHLERLDISENAVTSVQPLVTLQSLAAVDLRGNDRLVCDEADALRNNNINVQLPRHCLE